MRGHFHNVLCLSEAKGMDITMLKLRINPLVATDLKEIRDYIAEDNAECATKTI